MGYVRNYSVQTMSITINRENDICTSLHFIEIVSSVEKGNMRSWQNCLLNAIVFNTLCHCLSKNETVSIDFWQTTILSFYNFGCKKVFTNK